MFFHTYDKAAHWVGGEFMKILAIITIALAALSSPLLAEEEFLGAEISNAIDSGDLNAVKALIEGGLSIESPIQFEQTQITPLIKACMAGQYEIASYFIQAGANVNWSNEGGKTALIAAVEANQLQLAQLLMQNGSNVNVSDGAHFTPLTIASAAGYDDIVYALAQSGASLQQETSGLTPLMLAASTKKTSTIALLVSLGAPINQASSVTGETALFSAIKTGDVETIQSLINLGANVNFRTSDSTTPLKLAGIGNQSDIVELLKSAGATQ
jgi:ankyrin repeat protein